MSFKDDVKLDVNHLDQAAIDQPTLYAEWGEKWALAVSERDQFKERLTAVKAQADDEIRQYPRNFGWSSDKAPTETWVASQVVLHPDVVEMNKSYLDSVSNVNMLSVAKEALDHRKKSLEILTQLYANNYFVARSRTDPNYVETLSKKGADEQNGALENNTRMSKRRRPS